MPQANDRMSFWQLPQLRLSSLNYAFQQPSLQVVTLAGHAPAPPRQDGVIAGLRQSILPELRCAILEA